MPRCCFVRCTRSGQSLSAVVAALLTCTLGVLVAYPLHDMVADRIRAGIRDYAVLDSDAAGSWPGFVDSRDPSAGQVTSSYWLYNITNPAEVLAGAKPNLAEVGPLRYRYINTKHEVAWDNDGNELTYKEYQRYIALDEATLELERTPITTMNVILLAALRQAALVDDLLPVLFPASKDPAVWFPALAMRDVLWGYTDAMFGQRFPGLQQNDTSLAYALAQHSATRIATGKADGSRGMEYLEWSGAPTLACCAAGPAGEATAGGGCAPQWDSFDATAISGVFGTAFHTFVDPAETLQLATYPFGIYRHWPLVCGNVGAGPGPGTLYDGTALTAAIGGCDAYARQGVQLLRFALPAWVNGNASVDAVEARAYNVSGPSGILDVAACESAAPIYLSKPHFLHASDALAAALTGLAPAAPPIHDSWLGVEPLTGQVVDFQFRIQINVRAAPVTVDVPVEGAFTYYAGMAPAVVPIGWGEQLSTADAAQGALLTSQVYTPLRVAAGLRWGGITLAAVAAIVGVVAAARGAGFCGAPRRAAGDDDADFLTRRHSTGALGASLLSPESAEEFYRGQLN